MRTRLSRRHAALWLLAPALARAEEAPLLLPLAGGGWRLGFAPGAGQPSPEQEAALRRLGAALATLPAGRIGLWAEVGEGEDPSVTRRLSLLRARAVKAALVAGGLDGTRVDIRALGRTGAGRDAVDILPPGAARP